MARKIDKIVGDSRLILEISNDCKKITSLNLLCSLVPKWYRKSFGLVPPDPYPLVSIANRIY